MLPKLFSCILVVTTICRQVTAKQQTISLGDLDWTVSNNDNATVPGEFPSQAHLDLYRAGVIGDPQCGFNDVEQLWVQRSNWTWSTKSIKDVDLGKDLQTWLIFEGLDTFAHIQLCGKEVANTRNMYRQYAFDVSKILGSCKGTNKGMSINFGSASKIALEIAKTGPSYINFTDGVNGNEFDGKAYLRKEQNDFGWDWSPSLAPAGPWRPARFVQISRKHDPAIEINTLVDIYREGQMNNLSPDQSKNWVFNASIDYLGTLPKDAKMRLDLKDADGFTITSKALTISGRNKFTLTGHTSIARDSVELWWPNGMGSQTLYQAKITVTSSEWSRPLTVTKRVGFRTIVLNLNPITDTQIGQGIAPGANWHFEINGKEMYAKGANLTPLDTFWPRVDMDKTRELFDLVVNANQNMLRVWSSGTYLSDDIYDLADEMGILLWSEFQFTDAQYPVTPDYIEEYEAEAYYNVRRINHHASLALWAGGNELEAIILQYFNGPGEIRDGYEKLVLEILIKCVYANTRSISYIPSSTYHGYTKLDFDAVMPQTPRYDKKEGANYMYANTDSYDGDASQAFNYSKRSVGRFAVEFGTISMPSLQTWRTAIPKKDLYVESPSVLHHNRHYGFGVPPSEAGSLIGISEATNGVVQWYPQPDVRGNTAANFSAWCWATQVYQADKYAAEIAFYRRGSALRERQLGSLFWQLNDLWVAPTWAAVESTGRTKVMYYATRDIYKPVIAWAFYDEDADSLSVWVISDHFDNVKGTAKLNWQDWHGRPIKYKASKNAAKGSNAIASLKVPFQVGPLNGTEVQHYENLSTLFPNKKAMENALLHIDIVTDTKERHSVWFHPAPLTKASLPNPKLTVKPAQSYPRTLRRDDHVEFTVTSRSGVAANVWLEYPSTVRGFFDDNGFWLDEGETKTVKFTIWDDHTNPQDWVKQVIVRSIWDNTQGSPKPYL